MERGGGDDSLQGRGGDQLPRKTLAYATTGVIGGPI